MRVKNNVKRTRQFTRPRAFCWTLAIFAICSGFAQADEIKDVFTLSCEPVHEQILVGEPLFVKVVIENRSGSAQTIGNLSSGRQLHELPWRLWIAAGEGPLVPVNLSRIANSVVRRKGIPTKPAVLPAGGQLKEYFTFWFSAQGDLPKERSLIFRASGRYRYRIALSVALGSREAPRREVIGEGEVTVSGDPKGFSEMVRGLRGIMFDDSRVPYRNVEQLDSLLAVLKDSPYAKFVKWQRIRSYLLDGVGKNGIDALEDIGAAEEAVILSTCCEDLLSDAELKESPMHRDAGAMKGILLLVGKRKRDAPEAYEEARKIYETLMATYGYSRELNTLKQWAF